jgi:hypothetical protein
MGGAGAGILTSPLNANCRKNWKYKQAKY